MARIYKVRERLDGRYDMTVSSDEEKWCHPIGYCVGWKELSTDDDYQKAYPFATKAGMIAALRAEDEKFRPFKDKFHQDGHATRAEAEACYRDYEFQHELRFFQVEHTQHKCDVCGIWTQGVGELGMFRFFKLCPEHANREGIELALAKSSAKS